MQSSYLYARFQNRLFTYLLILLTYLMKIGGQLYLLMYDEYYFIDFYIDIIQQPYGKV